MRTDDLAEKAFGARPFARADHAAGFRTLAGPVPEASEVERFLGLAERLAERLPEISADEVGELTVSATGLPGPPKGLF